MNIALDCFSILILLLLYFNFGAPQIKRHEFDDSMFTCMVVTNIALLVSDILTWALDGAQFEGAHILLLASHFLYYSLQPLMCLFWLMYCEYKLTENAAHVRRRIPFYAFPAVLSIACAAVSCFTPLIFSVNAENIYSRARFYGISALICAAYLIYPAILTILALKRDRARKFPQHNTHFFLLIYPMFPIVGLAVQSCMYGTAIVWSSSVISLLILYFNVQNAQITIDPLTGINNRHRFESYIKYRLNNRQGAGTLFVLMIDIDILKHINDHYGHLAGDDAIRETAQLLLSGVQRSDFVARIGGDEFAVVGERDSFRAITATMDDIQNRFHAFNQEGRHPYTLTISIGYSLFPENSSKTADVLLREADQHMYDQKKRHHESEQPR